MVTITKRGKQVNLKSLAEWYEFIHKKYGNGQLEGLVAFEQGAWQSMKYKVCIECLSTDNLVLQDKRALIKSTDYYLCQDCVDYYNNK